MAPEGSIIKPDGARVKDYTYDEFGKLEEGGDQGFLNETTYTGSVKDESTGLQYMNARYYNPESGRFLSQDTYSGSAYEPWTQHLYSYCGNNPTSMVDPTGHSFFNIGQIISKAKKALNEALNVLIGCPFKSKVTSKTGSDKEQERATQYSSGYKETIWDKSDSYKNITAEASYSNISEQYGKKGVASHSLSWYLYAKGAPKEFSLPQAYDEDQDIRNLVDSEIRAQQIAATRIFQTKKNGEYNISSETHDSGEAANLLSDWKYALGKYQISGASIVLKRGNEYAMLSRITVYDRYNYDPGYFEGLGKLAESGAAYNYDHYGYYYKFSTWTTGG